MKSAFVFSIPYIEEQVNKDDNCEFKLEDVHITSKLQKQTIMVSYNDF